MTSIIVFRDMLQIVREAESPITYSFSTSHVNNCELVDQIGFEKALTQMFEQRGLHKATCSLSLDESCLFWKKLPLGSSADSFVALIPLPLDQLAHSIFQFNSEEYVVGYNSSILDSLERALHASSNKTISLSIGSLEGKELNSPGLLNSHLLLFPSTQNKTLFYLLFSFFCLLLILAVFYFVSMRQTQIVKPVVEIARPTLVPSPTIRYLTEDEITVEVLNGSGIVGEAGRFKSTLETKNYTISAVGTASEDIEYTQIASKHSVPPSFLEILKKIVETQYMVSSASAFLPESTTSADIIITIGTASALLR